jgi:hypothetical protein
MNVSCGKCVAAAAILVVALLMGVGWMRGASPLFNLFFPPANFYSPMAYQAIEDKSKGYLLEVMHRYPGNYEVEIYAPTSSGVGVPYQVEFDADIEVKTEKMTLLHNTSSKESPQFWGRAGGGITLLRYRVPEQVPRNELVQINVAITGDIGRFNKKYGTSVLLVAKSSDE